MKKECHLIKLHLKQGICNLSRNMSHYFLMFHRSHFCAEPRRRVDGLENQTNDPPSSHPVCFCLVLSGHRAAEEGGEEVGQEVQVDELESGVRPSLLHSLAQPLHSPRPRQGRPLPVHCVDDWSQLNLPPHWPEPELSLDFPLSFLFESFTSCYFRLLQFLFSLRLLLWLWLLVKLSSFPPTVSLCGAEETVALLKHLKLQKKKKHLMDDGHRLSTASSTLIFFFLFLLYVRSFPHLKLSNVNSHPQVLNVAPG